MVKKLLCITIIVMSVPLEMVAQKDSLSFKDRYEAFKKRAEDRYSTFRDNANQQYAAFMEKAWKRYGVEEPIMMPKIKKLEPVKYDRKKEQTLLQAKIKKLLEEQKRLDEKRQEQNVQLQKVAEQERKQQDAQQELAEERQKLEEARKQLDEDRQMFMEQQNLLQKQAEEQKKLLSEQLQQIEEKKLQQETEQKRLDEEKNRQQQQQELFNKEKAEKEVEQQKIIADADLKQQEVQQKLLEEQQKLEEAKKQLEEDRQKLVEEQRKQQQLSDEKEKLLAEQINRLQEQQCQQDEEKKRLAENSKQDKQGKDDAKRKIAEEEKKLREAQKLLKQEQKELLAQKQQQQSLIEQKERQLSEKQKQLDASIKKQAEQKAQLDEEQRKQEQQRKLLAEKQKRQETERQQQLNEQNKRLQEEQQKLLAERQKLENERKQFLAERQKQEEEQKKVAEAKKKELETQQRQLDESVKKQQTQQQLLDEKKKQQEEQNKLLAEERAKQERQQKEIDRQKKELEQGKALEAELVIIKEDVKPQPEPVVPIKENKETVDKNTFMFYGTPMVVRWGNASKFKLAGTDKKSISKAYLELTGSRYDNLLHDCLALRKDKDLCDWAYYKMLQDMAEAACGKGTNEAVLLQGVLYQQSGYMMRFGLDNNQKLHILSRMNGTVYDRSHWIVDDKDGNKRIFFLMDGSKPKNLEICDVPYPKEQSMSFSIPKLPKLNTVLSNERQFYSGEPKMMAKASVNKNMIDFFNDYPASFKDNDITTRWPYYANAPLTKEVKEDLYSKLKPQIANASKLMAANALLAWVQWGLDYAIDERVWGSDRAFFAEETLYYPYCDCEDRSILYSYLVRDLLGLDVVMMYYPNEPQHMYTAVCFDDDSVQGDYIIVNGRKFIIADPTCYGAPVGHTGNQMDNQKAKVIPLKRL